jgi:ABC-2 type transport system permease protein
MYNSRLLSVMRKELIQIMRDRRTVIITFIQPIIMLFLLGAAATTDVRNAGGSLRSGSFESGP